VKASPTAARWLPTATVAVGALCRDGAACGGEGDRGPPPGLPVPPQLSPCAVRSYRPPGLHATLIVHASPSCFVLDLLFVLLGNEELL